MREYTRTGRRMGEEDIDTWRDCHDRDGCLLFAEVIRIIRCSRDGYGYRDELEMEPITVNGECRLSITPDACVLIHDNWHHPYDDSVSRYVYGLHMARGFEALLVDMDMDAVGHNGIVMGSRCGSVRISPGRHAVRTAGPSAPEDISRLVRAVHGSLLDAIEPGMRFDAGFGMSLEVVRLLGGEHWSDIVMRADYDDGGGISFTMYGIPVPDHDCIVLTLGCSALRIPIPEDVVREEPLACGKGSEATRMFLAEHPVGDGLLDGLDDARPSPSNPTRVGLWYRGDEREYPFPEIFERYEIWWGSPLCLMSPDNSEEDNEIFSNRHYCWDDPETVESQSECLKPNFLFKPTGFEVTWYKHPFRSMWMNQDLSPREIMHLMCICDAMFDQEAGQ